MRELEITGSYYSQQFASILNLCHRSIAVRKIHKSFAQFCYPWLWVVGCGSAIGLYNIWTAHIGPHLEYVRRCSVRAGMQIRMLEIFKSTCTQQLPRMTAPQQRGFVYQRSSRKAAMEINLLADRVRVGEPPLVSPLFSPAECRKIRPLSTRICMAG